MKRLIALSLLLSISSSAFADVVPSAPSSITATATTQQSSQQPLTEDSASELVSIEKTPILLSSHLKRRYAGYKVTLTSHYPDDLNIRSASIQNGVTGVSAAESTSTSWGNIFWGLPLWLLGMGIAAVVISGKNHKAETEGFQFSNEIPTASLNKGETLAFNALVPIGQSPQIKIHFKDTKTGLQFSKNSV
jgi:hypothetical protein